MRMKSVGVTLALALVAAACGGGDETTAPTGNTQVPAGGISVTNNAFSPATKTIPAGTTVRWAWSSCSGGDIYGPETCVAHSVTFDDGTTSPTQEKGSYSRTFSTAGSYPYHCTVHGAAMSGSISVQ